MEPKVNLKKVEVNEGAMDVEIESEEIVRFYVDHMKELFDSVKGADNYYTLTMKFAGDGKQYTITFQRHPGKTPGQIYDKQIRDLELKLAQAGIEADQRLEEASDFLLLHGLFEENSFSEEVEKKFMKALCIAAGKEESCD